MICIWLFFHELCSTLKVPSFFFCIVLDIPGCGAYFIHPHHLNMYVKMFIAVYSKNLSYGELLFFNLNF